MKPKPTKAPLKPIAKAKPRASAPAKPEAVDGELAPLSKFQAFTTRRVNRSEFKNAPYNANVCDAATKRRIKKVLKKDGLLEPLVWNERSGNMVGGHNRLELLDQLHEGNPYSLDTAVVSLGAEEEVRASLILNNRGLAGQPDVDASAKLADEYGLALYEAAGYERMEMEELFADTDHARLFAESEESQNDHEVMAEMAAGEAPDASGGDEGAPALTLENGEKVRDPKAHAALVEEREKLREKMKAKNKGTDVSFYMVTVCRNDAEGPELDEAWRGYRRMIVGETGTASSSAASATSGSRSGSP